MSLAEQLRCGQSDPFGSLQAMEAHPQMTQLWRSTLMSWKLSVIWIQAARRYAGSGHHKCTENLGGEGNWCRFFADLPLSDLLCRLAELPCQESINSKQCWPSESDVNTS